MGTIADSLFNVLMSWVRALVNALWALFSADRTTALEFLGKNWIMIAAVMIACGLVIDWIIWLLRWQPYHLWAQRVRRLLRLEEPQEEAEEETGKARAAALPEKRYAAPQRETQREEAQLYLHGFEEDEVQEVMEHADEVPDEELAAYPGMLYGRQADEAVDGYTRSYSMVTQEGPGAAEVARRRAEIDAWQKQMQEEARARAEAEKARLAREAYEAEQARLAREAYEAEQARLAKEAYEAEQARLAQAEYERQMEEYERQRAQYERDLAEYERQKAAYEAQLAQEAEEQAEERVYSSRRRRAADRFVPEEDAVPAQDVTRAMKTVKAHKKTADKEKKMDPDGGFIGRVAKMIEPEEEALIKRKTLPPRVDMNDAFRTAKLPVVTPPRSGRRKK